MSLPMTLRVLCTRITLIIFFLLCSVIAVFWKTDTFAQTSTAAPSAPNLSLSLSYEAPVPPKMPPVPTGIQSMTDKIWTEYEKTKGHIAYTQLKMLERKYGVLPTAIKSKKKPKSYFPYDNYRYFPEPQGYTILDTVYKIPTFDYTRGESFSRELDFLTGKSAVDETLQLGSIASRRPVVNNTRETNLSSITRLLVKSHPWDKMIGGLAGKAEIPKIFSLVPADDFLIYFKKPQSFNALEAAFKEMSSLGDSFFDMKEIVGVKKEIASRLGISNIENFLPLAGEIAFVSEDLSFVPRTDYALIFAPEKKSIAIIEALIEKDKSSHGSVGEYYVIAGSDKLFQRIKEAYEEKTPSMYKAKDAEYALSALDDRRDGFIYFSEAFILKLVGPEYRINAGRRSEVLSKINTLQYSVFAYKGITGAWPLSLLQMAQEGYVDKIYIEGLVQEGFSVDPDGRARHKDWGTLYEVSSVSSVRIDKVTKAEADRYESFSEGYQSFWREYFDPIGIIITVGDYIYFHTIILPLIDDGQYQMTKPITGDTPTPFEGLETPLRQSPVLFLSHFNFDKFVTDVLYSLNTARGNAGTATAQANISSIRMQAELYYEGEGSYGPTTTSCEKGLFADISVKRSLQMAKEATQGTAICRATSQAYALSLEVKDLGAHLCVDSTGASSVIKNSITSTACGQALSSAEASRLQSEAVKNAKQSKSKEEIQKEKEEIQKEVNEDLWENFNLERSGIKKEEFNIFGMIGNEVQFGVGKDLPFELKNVADYDMFVAIKLTDTERMKKFINIIYKSFASEFSGNSGFGFFNISSDEPLKNSYNGMDYYVIPTGFVNLYYLYYNNYFYATVSQKGINNLIDSVTSKDNPGALTSLQKRALDYIGDKHNMVVTADLTPYSDYKKRLIEASIEPGYSLSSQAGSLRAYLADYYSAKSFLGGNGDKTQEYFTLPNVFRGLPLFVTDAGISLGKEKYSFDDVDFAGSYRPYNYYSDYYYDDEDKPAPSNAGTTKAKKKFSDLFRDEDKANILTNFNKFKGFSVGLSFTPEGLDAKVAIKNPLVDTPDERFLGGSGPLAGNFNSLLYGSIGVGTLIIIGGGIWLVTFLRRKKIKESSPQVTSENGLPPSLPKTETPPNTSVK